MTSKTEVYRMCWPCHLAPAYVYWSSSRQIQPASFDRSKMASCCAAHVSAPARAVSVRKAMSGAALRAAPVRARVARQAVKAMAVVSEDMRFWTASELVGALWMLNVGIQGAAEHRSGRWAFD